MSNQVLIVAGENAARTPAEIARSLRFTPVVTGSEQEAVELLARERFRLIAVSGAAAWQRVRDAAESKQPMTRVLELPEWMSDDAIIRRLMVRYLAPVATERARFTAEEKYRFLSNILESFTGTLELREVLRRIVTITREEFGADRAWLLHPVNEQSEYAKLAFAVNAPQLKETSDSGLVPLTNSQNLIRRGIESSKPVVVMRGDADLDPELAERFNIRSAVIQILRSREEEPWAFGLHMEEAAREWSEEEVSLFGEIGRYATLALNNTLLHSRAVREMAKVTAILDQIPESAAIYDAHGRLERMNAAAQREPAVLFAPDNAEGRARETRHRYIDGSPLSTEELPSIRALRGETVKSDYLIHDARTNDDRVVNLKAAPIRDDRGRIIGSVVLSRDVTDERQNAERESWRRRRAECLANLGLEMVAVEPSFDNLDEPAARIAHAVTGTVRIYLYHAANGLLDLVGYGTVEREIARYRDWFSEHPYRPGEGLPGTVFHIGRPLLFYEVRGDALLDYSRDQEERQVKAEMQEQSLIACPIESYGERIGALIISQSDPRRNFDAEDLEFAQSVADRIGAASHIHRLTRIAQDGHRAAEELARREVDARVRLEAVLETAPVGIAVISADELRFELANARFIDFATRMGRVTDDKLVGLRAAEVLPASEKILKQVAESGEARFDEEIAVGDLYFNRIVSAARGRFSGITQSLTVLVQDVTDQVRSRRQIEDLAAMMAERSARLDSILGSMTDGLWVYDANGTVIDVNQAALNMFGLASRAEAIELGAFDRFGLRDSDGRAVASSDMPHARALSGQTVPDYLAIGRHLLSNRDLDLSIAAAPIESKGIVGAVLVIRDITALQELDRKKDEFLSVASHELRTPLTTIKGYTQLLAQTVDELASDERATYISAVLGEIERMMGLISELLDVSRIETNRLQIHKQSIRWVEFIDGRVGAFRVQHPQRTIRFEVATPESTVMADPDRMRQVVDNLLSNAIKYSPEGTAIDVDVVASDGQMHTSVTDYGIGIPRDEIPQLFERFHRARNVSSRYYGGLGLGLYIARAIVEAHGGAISVQSEEGHGSTFTVRLPLPG